MSDTGLSVEVMRSMRVVFERHPGIDAVLLYGSRAKGTHRPQSDIDLALVGAVAPMEAQVLALELDELPLPYQFDVRCYASIKNAALRDHIDRVGKVIYRRAGTGDAP